MLKLVPKLTLKKLYIDYDLIRRHHDYFSELVVFPISWGVPNSKMLLESCV